MAEGGGTIVSGQTRCYCWQKATSVVKRMRNSVQEKLLIINNNVAAAAFRDMEQQYPEIQAPEAVKQLAKNHAKFLVSIHHLASMANQPSHHGATTKEETNAKEKQESQIPQLVEKSWPMYYIDNIRIRKICDVSTSSQNLRTPTCFSP